MEYAPDNPPSPKARLENEYDDPHYHDDDERDVDQEARGVRSRPRPPVRPARRIPPPRRRIIED
ncbi:MAG: hypothetical protein ACK4RK_15230 [Gemmataceae bacterium]